MAKVQRYLNNKQYGRSEHESLSISHGALLKESIQQTNAIAKKVGVGPPARQGIFLTLVLTTAAGLSGFIVITIVALHGTLL